MKKKFKILVSIIGFCSVLLLAYIINFHVNVTSNSVSAASEFYYTEITLEDEKIINLEVLEYKTDYEYRELTINLNLTPHPFPYRWEEYRDDLSHRVYYGGTPTALETYEQLPISFYEAAHIAVDHLLTFFDLEYNSFDVWASLIGTVTYFNQPIERPYIFHFKIINSKENRITSEIVSADQIIYKWEVLILDCGTLVGVNNNSLSILFNVGYKGLEFSDYLFDGVTVSDFNDFVGHVFRLPYYEYTYFLLAGDILYSDKKSYLNYKETAYEFARLFFGEDATLRVFYPRREDIISSEGWLSRGPLFLSSGILMSSNGIFISPFNITSLERSETGEILASSHSLRFLIEDENKDTVLITVDTATKMPTSIRVLGVF